MASAEARPLASCVVLRRHGRPKSRRKRAYHQCEALHIINTKCCISSTRSVAYHQHEVLHIINTKCCISSTRSRSHTVDGGSAAHSRRVSFSAPNTVRLESLPLGLHRSYQNYTVDGGCIAHSRRVSFCACGIAAFQNSHFGSTASRKATPWLSCGANPLPPVTA